MEEIVEKFLAADLPTQKDLAPEIDALPPEVFADAVAALPSMEDQQRIVLGLREKWEEDYGDWGEPPWETAGPTLLALRDRLLSAWEAADRDELDSMQVYRSSYIYSVGILASFKRDELFDRVKDVLGTKLASSDMAEDAKGVLRHYFRAHVN